MALLPAVENDPVLKFLSAAFLPAAKVASDAIIAFQDFFSCCL